MKRTCILLALFVTFAACDEDPTQGLLDIIDEDLGYVPVISSFSSVDGTSVEAGAQVTLDLRYWSEGDIARVQVWEHVTEQSDLVYDESYQPAYSYETRTDSLLVSYNVPDTLGAGSDIELEARTWNEGLEDHPESETLTITVSDE